MPPPSAVQWLLVVVFAQEFVEVVGLVLVGCLDILSHALGKAAYRPACFSALFQGTRLRQQVQVGLVGVEQAAFESLPCAVGGHSVHCCTSCSKGKRKPCLAQTRAGIRHVQQDVGLSLETRETKGRGKEAKLSSNLATKECSAIVSLNYSISLLKLSVNIYRH